MDELPTTGLELRLLRVAADVRVNDLAAAMKTTSASVSRWESSRLVTRKAAERYVAALATLATSVTPENGRAA